MVLFIWEWSRNRYLNSVLPLLGLVKHGVAGTGVLGHEEGNLLAPAGGLPHGQVGPAHVNEVGPAQLWSRVIFKRRSSTSGSFPHERRLSCRYLKGTGTRE